MVSQRFHKALESLSSLGDPVRRRLYESVAAEGKAVSRNEIAKATGVARPLVAYHLDRLVKDGLLATRFERQTGRTGPGAGRPSKLYFRPQRAIQISLPARDSELVARVLMEAYGRTEDEQTRLAVTEAAGSIGRELARQEGDAGPVNPQDVLAQRGYEPQEEEGQLTLRNCVFDELAEQERDLVCGMNLSLLQGLLEEFPDAGMRAELRPAPGRCCVVFVPSETDEAADDSTSG